jgi:hypothetical protein
MFLYIKKKNKIFIEFCVNLPNKDPHLYFEKKINIYAKKRKRTSLLSLRKSGNDNIYLIIKSYSNNAEIVIIIKREGLHEYYTASQNMWSKKPSIVLSMNYNLDKTFLRKFPNSKIRDHNFDIIKETLYQFEKNTSYCEQLKFDFGG